MAVLTPVEVEVLIKHYYLDFPFTKEAPEAVLDSVQRLRDQGLLNWVPDKRGPLPLAEWTLMYEVSALGEAHIQQITCLPLPVERTVFIGADGKPIE